MRGRGRVGVTNSGSGREGRGRVGGEKSNNSNN